MGLYLLKICIYQLLFASVYLVFLRKLTLFRANRIYLLATLLLSLLLPPFQYDFLAQSPFHEEISEILLTTNTSEYEWWIKKEVPETGFPISLSSVFLLLYLTTSGVLLLRFTFNFFKIKNLKHAHELIENRSEIKVFRTSLAQPFSFFNSVFIPNRMWDDPDLERVLAHEKQHVLQKHSYDRLLVDLILALLWINPFIYLFKRLLIEVHEFEADAAVVDRIGDKLHYQLAILTLAERTSVTGLVSFFNFSTIKRRITMMNHKKSNRKSLFRMLIALPVTVGTFFLFSFHPTLPDIPFRLGSLADFEFLLNNKQTDDIPSIMPVKVDELKRMSSAYGMRLDPISKEKRMHRGVDFAAPSGSEVIATADGTVNLSTFQPNGYGKHLFIQHNESFKTHYAQLDSYVVKEGETVKKGQLIGYVGSSGRSTAPHLHYEVIKDGKPVNPADYIKDYEIK